MIQDYGVAVPAHPVPRVLRDASGRGPDIRPGGAEDIDSRVPSRRPFSESGGYGSRDGRKEADPVKTIRRRAVRCEGTTP